MQQRGWLAFARAIEHRYLALGGSIRYRARVARIIVVSAADGRTTLFEMLGGSLLDKAARASYELNRVSDQPVRVNLGFARGF